MTYFFVRRLFDHWTAVLTIILLSTDLTYIFLNRSDNGPIAMMMVCKMGALLFILKWWQTDKTWALSLGGFLLGLGLSDKANFIQFIISLVIISIILLGRKVFIRLWSYRSLIPGLCFLIGGAPFLVYHISYPTVLFQLWMKTSPDRGDPFGVRSSDLLISFQRLIDLAFRTFNGTFEQGWVLGKVLINLWIPYLLLGSIPVFIILIMIMIRSRSLLIDINKLGFIIFLSLLLFIMLVFTPQARFSWHFFILYPFPYIFCSAVFASLLRAIYRSKKVFNIGLWLLIITGILAVVSINLKGVYLFHREISADRVIPHWSSRIYDLAEYLQNNPHQKAICMDWGFYNGLAFLLRGETYLEDSWQLFSAGKKVAYKKLRRYFNHPGVIFLFYPPRFTSFKETRTLFEEALEYYNYREIKVESFYDGRGGEIIFLSRVIPIDEK